MKPLLKFNVSPCNIVGGHIIQETADSYRTFLNSRDNVDFLYVYDIEHIRQGLYIVRVLPRDKEHYTSQDMLFIESNGLVFGFSATMRENINNKLSRADSYFILTSNATGLIFLSEPSVITFELTVNA